MKFPSVKFVSGVFTAFVLSVFLCLPGVFAATAHTCTRWESPGVGCVNVNDLAMPTTDMCVASSTVSGWNTACNGYKKLAGGTTYEKIISCNAGTVFNNPADCIWPSPAVTYCNSLNRATAHTSTTDVCGACKDGYAEAAGADPNTVKCGKIMGPIAKENAQMGNFWLSNDGENEGIFVAISGNVGVGTNNPQVKLEVAGNTKISGVLNIDKIGSTALQVSGTEAIRYDGTAPNRYFSWGQGGHHNYFQNSVGIKTNDPQADLEVMGSIKGKFLNITDGADINNLTVNKITADDIETKNINVTEKMTVKDITIDGDIITVNKTNLVPKFVGKTTNSYKGKTDGNIGYKNADSLCDTAVTDSHICTSDEIMSSFVSGDMDSAAGMMWVNNGPPAYIDNLSNDCSGWQTDSISIYGSVINIDRSGFTADSFYVQPCSTSYPFACCK